MRNPSDRRKGDVEYSTYSRDIAEGIDLRAVNPQKIGQCGKTRKAVTRVKRMSHLCK
jgi:hypothetical protein